MSNSRGSLTVMASRSWRIDSRPSAGLQSSARKSEITAMKPRRLAERADPVERAGEVGAAHALRRRAARRASTGSARTWFEPLRGGITWIDGPATSTAPSRFWLRAVRNPTHGRGGHRRLRLVVGDRAELHRRRRVDDQPGGEVAVGDLLAHVGLVRAGRDVPVDAAHVVARLVLARLARLGAVARCQIPGGCRGGRRRGGR